MFEGEKTGFLGRTDNCGVRINSPLFYLVELYFINPGSVLQIALGTGMPPSSIVDGHNWSFFQAYAWLSYSGRSYLRLDEYWKFLVPSIVGASTFMLVGLYMMKSGVEKEKEREARLLKRQESLNDQKLH